jgi:hypothetical protein
MFLVVWVTIPRHSRQPEVRDDPWQRSSVFQGDCLATLPAWDFKLFLFSHGDVLRVVVCDTSDKEPEGCLGYDWFC